MQSLLHRSLLNLFLLGVILTMSDVRARAATYNPVIEGRAFNITGQPVTEMLINGQLPGPLLLFKEDEIVTVNALVERPLVGEDIERKMGPALPQLCALGQAICVLVAPETTYKANWQLYRNGRPVEVLCVENSTKRAAYVVSRPQPERPPEFELEDGLKFCSPVVSQADAVQEVVSGFPERSDMRKRPRGRCRRKRRSADALALRAMRVDADGCATRRLTSMVMVQS